MLWWVALCSLLCTEFLLSALSSSLSVQHRGRQVLLMPLTQAASVLEQQPLLSSHFQPTQCFCANTFVVYLQALFTLRSHQLTCTELLLSVNEWVYVTLSKQLSGWSQKCRMQKNQSILFLCSFLFISLPRGSLVIHIMRMQNLTTLVVQSQNLTH